MADDPTPDRPAFCACGANPRTPESTWAYGNDTDHQADRCKIGGAWVEKDRFRFQPREYVLALQNERALVAELSCSKVALEAHLEASREEVRRLEAALERWRTLSLAQACVLAEDLQP